MQHINCFFRPFSGQPSGKIMASCVLRTMMGTVMVSCVIGSFSLGFSLGFWPISARAQETTAPPNCATPQAMLADLRDQIALLEKERGRLQLSPLISSDTMTLPTQSYEDGSKLRYLERRLKNLEEENANLKSQAPIEVPAPAESTQPGSAAETADMVKKFEAQSILLADENETLKKKLASLDPNFAKVYKPSESKKIEDVMDTLFDDKGKKTPPPPPPVAPPKPVVTLPDTKKSEKSAQPAQPVMAEQPKTEEGKTPKKNKKAGKQDTLRDDVSGDLMSPPKAKDTATSMTAPTPAAPVPIKPMPDSAPPPLVESPPQVAPKTITPELPKKDVQNLDKTPVPRQPAPETLPVQPAPPIKISTKVPAPSDVEITPFNPNMIKTSKVEVPKAALPQQTTPPSSASSVEITPFDSALINTAPSVEINPQALPANKKIAPPAVAPAVNIAPFDPTMIGTKTSP